jgi:hypothetical protein
MSKKFTLEVDLNETEYCYGCPCWESRGDDYCRADPDLRNLPIGNRSWEVARPDWCPLKEVATDAE